MASTFAYSKSCASAVAFIFAMHCLENEGFSKFNPQKYKPRESRGAKRPRRGFENLSKANRKNLLRRL